MTASIKPFEIAKAMVREGKHKTLVARWYALTTTQNASEVEKIVRSDRLWITDADFRKKYCNYIKGG